MASKRKVVKLKQTRRGFALLEFEDRNGEKCSLQKSSLATEDAIWFGCDDAKPQVLIPGQGWTPVEVPPGTLFTTRMHLTTKMVKRLLPYLRHFAKTGDVARRHTRAKAR